jgi:hypothetical protein
MVYTVVGTEAVTVGILYRTALREERARLEETAQSQARLIEAVARFDATHTAYPDGARHATPRSRKSGMPMRTIAGSGKPGSLPSPRERTTTSCFSSGIGTRTSTCRIRSPGGRSWRSQCAWHYRGRGAP